MSYPESAYHDHAARLQRKAEEAHSLWLSTLTEEQYAQALEYGVIDPPKDSHKVGGHSPDQKKDLAESPRASVEIDIASEIDALPQRIADKFTISLKASEEIAQWHIAIIERASNQHQAEIIQNIVAGLLSAKNPKLAAAGIAFATKLDALNGLNQVQFAKENNISRQAVSKCTKHWQKILGVRPSAHQKSEGACDSYRKSSLSSHWRKKKFKLSDHIKKRTQPNNNQYL
jgi:hypothetical protein